MQYLRDLSEGDPLLRVKLYDTGTTSWELRVVSSRVGTEVVSVVKLKGDDGDLRKALMKMKASDALSAPATKRNLSYNALVQSAIKGKDNEVWIRRSKWNDFRISQGQ